LRGAEAERLVHGERSEADIGAVEVIQHVADAKDRHEPPGDALKDAPLGRTERGGIHRCRGGVCGHVSARRLVEKPARLWCAPPGGGASGFAAGSLWR
jgi:hypothetical protein